MSLIYRIHHTKWNIYLYFVYYRSRSFYSSLVSILNQLLAFVATLTYYDSERLLSLSGVFCFYAVLGAIGYSFHFQFHFQFDDK